MASRISRRAVKSGCACEWGAWGQISADGPGHYNPDRSEDPWGRVAEAARAEVHKRTTFPDTVRGFNVISDGHEGRWQTGRGEDPRAGKAAPEIPALKPYWGKPTVRNFRGGDGNRGIIRSPQSAIVLPGELEPVDTRTGLRAGRVGQPWLGRVRGSDTGPRHYPRWEPCALGAPARFCAGGAGQPASLPRR